MNFTRGFDFGEAGVYGDGRGKVWEHAKGHVRRQGTATQGSCYGSSSLRATRSGEKKVGVDTILNRGRFHARLEKGKHVNTQNLSANGRDETEHVFAAEHNVSGDLRYTHVALTGFCADKEWHVLKRMQDCFAASGTPSGVSYFMPHSRCEITLRGLLPNSAGLQNSFVVFHPSLVYSTPQGVHLCIRFAY